MARSVKKNNIYFRKEASGGSKGGRPWLVLNKDGEELIEKLYICVDWFVNEYYRVIEFLNQI